jgi:hypothetical protein
MYKVGNYKVGIYKVGNYTVGIYKVGIYKVGNYKVRNKLSFGQRQIKTMVQNETVQSELTLTKYFLILDVVTLCH